jgi:hypothetical protein
VLPSEDHTTEGSLERSYVPPSQIVNAAWLLDSDQFVPLFAEYTATSPLAPPSFQRSCWKAATRFDEFCGSTATYGSTSVSG